MNAVNRFPAVTSSGYWGQNSEVKVRQFYSESSEAATRGVL